MANDVAERLAERVRGRPFAKGQSGNPGGRQLGSRNKATIAAQMLLADEAEALTRKAVELALGGDPTALGCASNGFSPATRGEAHDAADHQRRRCRRGDGGRSPRHSPKGSSRQVRRAKSLRSSSPSSEPSRPAISTGACNFSKPARPLIRPASRPAATTQLNGELSLLIRRKCSDPNFRLSLWL